MQGIYAIRNMVTGAAYYGSSQNIPQRMQSHRRVLGRGAHGNERLMAAWIEFGADNFEFVIVEEVLGGEAELLRAEQGYISRNPGGYNICARAGRPPNHAGWTDTLETRYKKSLGNRRWKRTAETKLRIGASSRGHVMHSATREALLSANTGRQKTATEIELLRTANLGKKMSDESRRKMSEAGKRRKLSAAHRAAISRGLLGHVFSEESRRKISETKKAQFAAGTVNRGAAVKRSAA